MTPLAIARQALMQLSQSQSPPTPENYHRVYDEIAGIHSLTHVATQPAINTINQQDDAHLKSASHLSAEAHLESAESWRNVLIHFIQSLSPLLSAEGQQAAIESDRLLGAIKSAQTTAQIKGLSELLVPALLGVKIQIDSQQRMQESLLQMLRLLTSTMGELAIADHWLNGQLAIVQNVVSQPLNIDSLYKAQSSLQALILKQSTIKPGLIEAKEAIKGMMTSFMSGLTDITQSAGTYQTKVATYQKQISATEDIAELNVILQCLAKDIHTMNDDAEHSQAAFLETQKKVEAAEKQIGELTAQLDYISEVAHEDFLTGTLNRRGMEEAIEREFARADKSNTSLSLAIIDIDHFKKINDAMGHSTGDVALEHLAKVVKSILRSTDVLARYGGEEFIILLPDCKQSEAVNVITAIQRELTKNFFMYNSERVLITFSAGVAERQKNEHIDAVLPRADAALYIAKQAGRNRVVGAQPATFSSG